jgi:hypothetical protein
MSSDPENGKEELRKVMERANQLEYFDHLE